MYALEASGAVPVIGKTINSLGTKERAASIGAPSAAMRVRVDVFKHVIMGREYVGCCEGDSVAQVVSSFSHTTSTMLIVV